MTTAAKALTRLKRASAKIEKGKGEALAAMLEARAEGATLAEIAEASGMSRPGVLKMLRRQGG
jgi:DNA-binding phage protein